MTTVFKEAQKIGINNKRLLSIAGRIILEWYNEHAPQAVGKTESTEVFQGVEKTFVVVGYPNNEAGRIQLMLKQIKQNRRNVYKSKNINQRNKRPRIKKSFRQNKNT